MNEPRWLDQDEMRAWLGYRRMHLLLDLQVSRDLAADSGLSDADYDVLSSLSDRADRKVRLSDLAARMLWSKSRLSHHIGRMEQRGLVTREDCAGDDRGAVAVLTAAGRRAIETAAPPHVASVRRHLIDLLTAEQVRSLGDITDTVLAHLRTVAEPTLPRAAKKPGVRSEHHD